MSMTRRASRSFGLMVLSSLESFMAMWCTNSSCSLVGAVGEEAMQADSEVTTVNRQKES